MYTVGTLLERYGLSKSQVYARLNYLGIELEKTEDGRSFATEEQVQRLDNLHDWLKDGDKKRFMREYRETTEVEVMSEASIAATEKDFTAQGDLFIFAANTILQKIQDFTISPPDKQIKQLKALEELVTYQWLVSTSQVEELIGIRPSGAVFTLGSFTFVRQGRYRREASWVVVKTKVNLIGMDDYS